MSVHLGHGVHPSGHDLDEVTDHQDDQGNQDVAVRRNVVLSGVVGGLALLLGASFLLRAGSAFDVLLGLVLVVVALGHVPALTSARTPVLVADDHGIRLRVGTTWRGVPWSAMRQVVVEDAASVLREGRLVIVPLDRSELLRRVGPLAEAHLRWNTTWYGAPLAVPLGMTTHVDSADLAADLVELAAGRVPVVHHTRRSPGAHAGPPAVAPAPAATAVVPPVSYAAEGQPVPDEGDEPVSFAPAEIVESYVVAEEVLEVEVTAVPDVLDEVEVVDFAADAAEVRFDEPEVTGPVLVEPALPEPVLPLRAVHEPVRVDVRLEQPVDELVEVVAVEQTEDTGPLYLVRDEAPGWDDLPVGIVIDDLAGPGDRAGAPVPVIGAKVAHAREILDMSIEELSQRTRIRTHVLEAIERDDFAPCGGDFYARGHLTAISRALGLTLDPLLATYDDLYAEAPINARRVFEADQTTGLSGGKRATLGGPRWSLLIGSVLSLTMIWGLARIFAGEPEQLTAAPESSETAGLAGNQTPITSPKMKTTSMSVHAAYAATHVVVKDRTGKVLWSGDLAHGRKRKIIGLAPFTVAADNAGAVLVSVKGKQLGDLGTAGEAGSKKFG